MNSQHTYGKVPNITYHPGNANLNHSEVSPHTHSDVGVSKKKKIVLRKSNW